MQANAKTTNYNFLRTLETAYFDKTPYQHQAGLDGSASFAGRYADTAESCLGKTFIIVVIC